ncbi:hypothetical protein [Streptomyces sp. NPDC055109]
MRQIGHLVQELTRQEMGLAEPVRNSWTRFYRETSGVLHGSGATPAESRDRFEGVVAAFGHLFLGLPGVPSGCGSWRWASGPRRVTNTEIASVSDPRAGNYFFRAAVSRHWLGLLRDGEADQCQPVQVEGVIRILGVAVDDRRPDIPVGPSMAEVFAIRPLDALDGNGLHVRSHDGNQLLRR